MVAVIALSGFIAGDILIACARAEPSSVTAASSAPNVWRLPSVAGSRALAAPLGADSCRGARRAVRYYRGVIAEWAAKMGAGDVARRVGHPHCPRYLARVLRAKARAWRLRYERWWHHHYAWWDWLPDKWARIGACETGYGRRPGQWTWNSGAYQGAFGFAVSSWDAFKLPGYPSEAYLATPRQQYNVALEIYERYGFSGWGCRGA